LGEGIEIQVDLSLPGVVDDPVFIEEKLEKYLIPVLL
jgi:hypothetical protein